MKDKLVTETAKIEWTALERFYAQGRVLHVIDDADLVEIAAAFAEDDAEKVKLWQDTKKFARVSDEQAIEWIEQDALVWAVTVAPFVLVQSVTGHKSPPTRG